MQTSDIDTIMSKIVQTNETQSLITSNYKEKYKYQKTIIRDILYLIVTYLYFFSQMLAFGLKILYICRRINQSHNEDNYYQHRQKSSLLCKTSCFGIFKNVFQPLKDASLHIKTTCFGRREDDVTFTERYISRNKLILNAIERIMQQCNKIK